MKILNLSRHAGRLLLAGLVVVNVFYFIFHIAGTQQNDDSKLSKSNYSNSVKFKNYPIPNIKYPNSDVGPSKKIIVRVLKSDCGECQDSIFTSATMLTKSFGKESVIVLLNSSYDESEYLILKRLYQYDLNVYQRNENISKLDDDGKSYYFLLDKVKGGTAQKVLKITSMADASSSTLFNNWLSQLTNEFSL